jgi:hypothetical protein
MAEFQSRQGDIFFRSVSKLPPKGLKKKADAILAYGEVTGHSHQHNTIVLPAGQWICVSRQREYDPLAANRERRVLD